MPAVTVPKDREAQILRENNLNPNDFGVMYKDANCIRLLCYATRDIVTIHKGDRKW